MDQRSKILITGALIFIGLGILFVVQAQSLGKLRLIACDVGQGDGFLIVTPQGKQIVVDGGPGTKITDCLGSKMPLWDRTIEMVVLTHPQKDHLEGLIEILARYQVKIIATTQVKNETEVYKAWEAAVKRERAKIYEPLAGDLLILDQHANQQQGPTSLELKMLWPNQAQIAAWKDSPPKDLNETSIVARLNYGQFCAYLTGDIPKQILAKVVDKPCQVLKVSHHGSKTGTSEEVLAKIMPELAIIQVGRNSFGHPHKEVLDLLTSKGVKILRNDTNGIIELVINDGKFRVKVEKGKISN